MSFQLLFSKLYLIKIAMYQRILQQYCQPQTFQCCVFNKCSKYKSQIESANQRVQIKFSKNIDNQKIYTEIGLMSTMNNTQRSFPNLQKNLKMKVSISNKIFLKKANQQRQNSHFARQNESDTSNFWKKKQICGKKQQSYSNSSRVQQIQIEKNSFFEQNNLQTTRCPIYKLNFQNIDRRIQTEQTDDPLQITPRFNYQSENTQKHNQYHSRHDQSCGLKGYERIKSIKKAMIYQKEANQVKRSWPDFANSQITKCSDFQIVSPKLLKQRSDPFLQQNIGRQINKQITTKHTKGLYQYNTKYYNYLSKSTRFVYKKDNRDQSYQYSYSDSLFRQKSSFSVKYDAINTGLVFYQQKQRPSVRITQSLAVRDYVDENKQRQLVETMCHRKQGTLGQNIIGSQNSLCKVRQVHRYF